MIWFFKKVNSIILMMFVLIIFGLITGCDGTGSVSSAKLLGYEESSFEETMEKYFEDMTNDEVVKLSSEWKEGWIGNGAPNSEVLNSNEKAMTYVIAIDLSHDDELETNRMIFYMVHDINENILSVHGGEFDEDGNIYYMGLDEARSELEMIFDEYN